MGLATAGFFHDDHFGCMDMDDLLGCADGAGIQVIVILMSANMTLHKSNSFSKPVCRGILQANVLSVYYKRMEEKVKKISGFFTGKVEKPVVWSNRYKSPVGGYKKSLKMW